MDISPTTRVLKRLTGEFLALLRTVVHLSPQEADSRLTNLSSRLRHWAAEADSPKADYLVRELTGLEGYSLWASSYDNDPDNHVIQAEEQHIWSVIGRPEGKTVLDVGSGTGRHAIRLAGLGAQVVASEPNRTLREMAKAKDIPAKVQWLEYSIEQLPSNLGRFDLVLCCLVLSHIENLGAAVRTLARYVSPGGRLILTDFHPFNIMLGWRSGFDYEGKRYAVPNYLHLPSEYFKALMASGLFVEELLEVGGFPNMPDQPATLILSGRQPVRLGNA